MRAMGRAFSKVRLTWWIPTVLVAVPVLLNTLVDTTLVQDKASAQTDTSSTPIIAGQTTFECTGNLLLDPSFEDGTTSSF